MERLALARAFEASNPASRPTEKQWEFFSDIAKIPIRAVRGGNQSSKSSTCTRELTWIMTGTHPHWKRPSAFQCPCCDAPPQRDPRQTNPSIPDFVCANGHSWRDWGPGPMLAIVAGQSKRNMETELWNNKMRPFFDMDVWKEEKTGGQLSRVFNRETGDEIIFLSHNDSSEKARRHMQGFVAHYVLLDEMPTSLAIFDELRARVDSRRGYFVSAFTPKTINGAIRRYVDALKEPTGKQYRFSKFQNPLFAGKEKEELAKLDGYSEAYKKCVLFGDWMPGDGLVYFVEFPAHGGPRPDHYSLGWRHVAVADPATESKLGLLVAAEDPITSQWWVVRADYVEGYYEPVKIVEEVEKRIASYNVVLRVSDPAATWFMRQAAAMPNDDKLDALVRGKSFSWEGVPEKTRDGKKDELERNLQQALGTKLLLVEGDESALLFDELSTCARSEDTGKIKKRSRFHLIDCAQYLVDRLPAPVTGPRYASFEERLRAYDTWRREREARRSGKSFPGFQQYTPRGALAPTGTDAPLPPMPRSNKIRRWMARRFL